MSRPTQEQEYYAFMNLNSMLKQTLIKDGFLNSLHYLKDIASVKVGMFKYKNIEKIPNMTSEILETIILFNNFLCFYDSPAFGIMLCRYRVSGELNEYLKPNFVDLLSIHGDTIATNVPYEDIILVRDNSLDIIPFIPMVEYIRKIEQCDTAVFKALNVACLPLVISGSKKIVKQANEVAKKLGAPDAFMLGDDQLMETVKAFDIDVKINPLDVYELKTKYKNECVASLGIYTVEQKKERKIVNEVNSQNEYTDSIYMDAKTVRQEFVDKLNSMYGFDIELIETKRVIAEQHIKDTQEMQVQNEGGTKDDSKDTNSDK